MNTKALYAAIAVIALLIVGFLIYNNSQKNNQVSSDTTQTSSADSQTAPTDQTTPPADSTTPSNDQAMMDEGHQSTGTDAGENSGVFQVTYDGTKFSPASLTIKQGDVVVFKNTGSQSFWPASDPHPTHTNYPEFDAKKAIGAGQSYQFKFLKMGTWGYHNHLNHDATGTIIVK